MYEPSIPKTGVPCIIIGVHSFYRSTLLILLIVTLTIILFRFIRLLIKEDLSSKKLLILIASILVLIFLFALIQFNNKIVVKNFNKQSKELLVTYKNKINNVHSNKKSLYKKNIDNKIKTACDIRLEEAEQAPKIGEVIGILNIEKISLELPIIEDSNDKNIWIGACHIRGTPYYWEEGNSFLAAHRLKTYGRLFNRLHELKIGDEVKVVNQNDDYIYVVYGIEIITPDSIECFGKIKGNQNLSLITCTKNGKERLLVYCRRIRKKMRTNKVTM